MEQVHRVKTVASGIIGTASAALGWFGWLVLIYSAAITLDWVTGTAAAKQKGEWSSKAAREGCWHKLGSIISILSALMLDGMTRVVIREVPEISLPFHYSVLLGPIVLVWYIVAELGSIIENAGKLGAPVPKFLTAAIHTLHTSAGRAGDQANCSEKDR